MTTIELPDPKPAMMSFIFKTLPGGPRSEEIHEWVDLPFRPMKGDAIYLATTQKDYKIVSGAQINTTGVRKQNYSTGSWETVSCSYDEHGTVFFVKPLAMVDDEV